MVEGYTIKFSGEYTFFTDNKTEAMKYFWNKMNKIGLGTGLFLSEVTIEEYKEEDEEEE